MNSSSTCKPTQLSFSHQFLNNQDFPKSVIRSLEPSKVYKLVSQLFNHHEGFIPNAQKVLLWFPKLLLNIYQLNQSLMEEETTIFKNQKFFIAILAVAAIGSHYMFARLTHYFIKAEGDEDWLSDGLAKAPPKFECVGKLCSLTATCPWAIPQMKVVQSMVESGWWTSNQLNEMFIIIGFYQSLGTFCLSMGLRCDYECAWVQSEEQFRDSTKKIQVSKKEEADILIKLKEQKIKEFLEEDDKVDFHQLIEVLPSKKEGKEAVLEHPSLEPFSKFRLKPVQTWSHFPRVLAQDFNFKENTFYLIQAFNSDLSGKTLSLLDEIKRMTNKNFGQNQGINTSFFRRAIRYYAQLRMGYRHSLFNYKGLNDLVKSNMKQLIKTVCLKVSEMKAEIVKELDWSISVMDYSHICLLICQAKMQFCLNTIFKCFEKVAF